MFFKVFHELNSSGWFTKHKVNLFLNNYAIDCVKDKFYWKTIMIYFFVIFGSCSILLAKGMISHLVIFLVQINI